MSNVHRKRREGVASVLKLHEPHRRLFLVLASLGFAINAYLTYAHYRLRVQPGWQSICAISDLFDCDAVISSPYGSLLGVPVSWIGAWFCAFVGFFSLPYQRRKRSSLPRSPATILCLLGAVVLVASLVLVGISILRVNVLCLFCIALCLINLGIVITAWRAQQAGGESLAQAFASEWQHWTVRRASAVRFVGLTTLSLAALWPIAWIPTRSNKFCELATSVSSKTPTDILVLDVYFDFQCAHCRRFDRALRRLRHLPRLRIAPHNFPLEQACNPLVKSGHDGACLQARAAICALDQGQKDDFSDRLFDTGATDVDALTRLAESIGLDGARFSSCIGSPDVQRQLKTEIDTAVARGVGRNPTVFVSGQRYAGPITTDDLRCLAQLASIPMPTQNGQR